VTVVLVTHDEAKARRARRVIRIQDGRIVEERAGDGAARGRRQPEAC
jgi:ABC-type lipoprotein export system ATPase subunit